MKSESLCWLTDLQYIVMVYMSITRHFTESLYGWYHTSVEIKQAEEIFFNYFINLISWKIYVLWCVDMQFI